ncbi:hypothetical protein [Streptomyces sp. MJM1172]|uniref:hypothetical protein n=1 Tax=Streptomyces sp. MJM1172 TaxID=1703926 RepID=UPI000AF17D2C|nr:hypothetical protein [Streptomyces sp. MJM1172]
MGTSTLYRPGGVVRFHARGPQAAKGRGVPLTVVPMSVKELRYYDWLLEVLREEGNHGDLIAANVYFEATGAFLGCFFGDGPRSHVEWWNDVTLHDLEFAGKARTAQIALNYMVDRWDWAHGRVLPEREPWESDEDLASRRRAVLEAHTVPGRPSPTSELMAQAIAEEQAAAAEREAAEARKRAEHLAAARTNAFGLDVELFAPYRVIDLAAARRPGRCEYGRCTQPAPVAIEADPWVKPDGRPRRYRACAFHFINALDCVFGG